MSSTCLQKQKDLKSQFNNCFNEDAKYQKIIELGKALPKLDPSLKTPQNIVKGCQSTVYLHSRLEGERIIFEAESDALISLGLAALLILVYSNETAETILKITPDYLDELGIRASLSPNRANGLYNIHLRMKQDALKLLVKLHSQ